MATTIEPEGDPTFLAYERARQFGESTLQRQAEKGQARATEDVGRGQQALGMALRNDLADNTAAQASAGRAYSSTNFRAQDRIRADIALRVGELLSDYQRTSTDITDDLADALAQSALDREEQALAARGRLTRDNASAGVGI